MSMNSDTKEYQELVAISQSLSLEYQDKNKQWEGSPFAWVKSLPSHSIGSIGERIVTSWLVRHDFNVCRSPDSDADRIVEGKRVEIKFSTLWENGTYVFQQLRDQNYDFAVFLGVSPNDAHCWVLPKADIIRMWKVDQTIPYQHGGNKKKSKDPSSKNTAWAHLSPNMYGGSEDYACSKYGNGLRDALLSISRLTGHPLVDLSCAFKI